LLIDDNPQDGQLIPNIIYSTEPGFITKNFSVYSIIDQSKFLYSNPEKNYIAKFIVVTVNLPSNYPGNNTDWLYVSFEVPTDSGNYITPSQVARYRASDVLVDPNNCWTTRTDTNYTQHILDYDSDGVFVIFYGEYLSDSQIESIVQCIYNNTSCNSSSIFSSSRSVSGKSDNDVVVIVLGTLAGAIAITAFIVGPIVIPGIKRLIKQRAAKKRLKIQTSIEMEQPIPKRVMEVVKIEDTFDSIS